MNRQKSIRVTRIKQEEKNWSHYSRGTFNRATRTFRSTIINFIFLHWSVIYSKAVRWQRSAENILISFNRNIARRRGWQNPGLFRRERERETRPKSCVGKHDVLRTRAVDEREKHLTRPQRIGCGGRKDYHKTSSRRCRWCSGTPLCRAYTTSRLRVLFIIIRTYAP